MKNIVICDIDGTLADCEHRRHLVEQSPPDWESFFREDLVMQDKVIEAVRSIIFEHLSSSYSLTLVTGRVEKHRQITDRWFARNEMFYERLYMRADGDFRSDEIVKEEILHTHIGVENVFCVFDDRQRVVDMWRRNGLTCFQVAPGDF